MLKRKMYKEEKILVAALIGFVVIIISLTILSLINKETKAEKFTYYHSMKIEYGDTLKEIGLLVDEYNDNLDFEHTMVEIMEINNIYNPDKIIAGTYIVVPYTDKGFLEVVE